MRLFSSFKTHNTKNKKYESISNNILAEEETRSEDSSKLQNKEPNRFLNPFLDDCRSIDRVLAIYSVEENEELLLESNPFEQDANEPFADQFMILEHAATTGKKSAAEIDTNNLTMPDVPESLYSKIRRVIPAITKVLSRGSNKDYSLRSTELNFPSKVSQDSNDTHINSISTKDCRSPIINSSSKEKTLNTVSSSSSHLGFGREFTNQETDDSSIIAMDISFSDFSIDPFIIPSNIDELDSIISNDCKEFNVASAQKFKLLCSDQTPRLWETTGNLPNIGK